MDAETWITIFASLLVFVIIAVAVWRLGLLGSMRSSEDPVEEADYHWRRWMNAPSSKDLTAEEILAENRRT
jgi:hypothetical protein